jgi:hypothetical protein
MNAPVAAALWCWVRSEQERAPRWELATGLALGAATLFKHQAVIVAPALLAASVATAIGRGGWGAVIRRGVLVAIGGALPWAASLLVYAGAGHAREFVEWVVLRNLGYVEASGGFSWTHAGALAYCVGLFLLPWSLAMSEAVKRRREPLAVHFASVLVLTWVAVAAGGRYYVHYFLQFAPLLGILGGPALARVVVGWEALSTRRRVAFLAFLALPIAGSISYAAARIAMRDFPFQDRTANAVADCIQRLTAPSERVFVWGHFSPLYYRSERLPGTRYLMTSVHMGNFDPGDLPAGFEPSRHRSDRDVHATIEDLRRNAPALVVDTAPADIHSWSKIPLAAFPELLSEVARSYQPPVECSGARLYRRAEAPVSLTSAPAPG